MKEERERVGSSVEESDEKENIEKEAQDVLKEYLVPKTEYLMLCNMSEKQKRCYKAGANYF